MPPALQAAILSELSLPEAKTGDKITPKTIAQWVNAHSRNTEIEEALIKLNAAAQDATSLESKTAFEIALLTFCRSILKEQDVAKRFNLTSLEITDVNFYSQEAIPENLKQFKLRAHQILTVLTGQIRELSNSPPMNGIAYSLINGDPEAKSPFEFHFTIDFMATRPKREFSRRVWISLAPKPKSKHFS